MACSRRDRKIRQHMTYLASFIIIGIKGLFRSDWLGEARAASPVGPQLVAGETGKSSNPPPHVGCELERDLAGFLDSAWAGQSLDTPPAFQLCNLSIIHHFQDKLLQTVYFIIMCHISW